MDLEKPIYTRDRGRTDGPFTATELKLRARSEKFSRFFQISNDQNEWSSAADFPELFPSPAEENDGPPTPPPAAVPPQAALAALTAGSRARLADQLVKSAVGQPASDSPAGYRTTPATPSALNIDSYKDGAWYYTQEERELGPVAFSEVQRLAAEGELQPNDFLWSEGMPEWVEARRVGGLFAQATPPGYVAPESPVKTAKLSLLAIVSLAAGLFGATGVFYLASIPAVVVGHIALRWIDIDRPRLLGRRMAMAGLILGYLVIILAIGSKLIAVITRGVPAGIEGPP